VLLFFLRPACGFGLALSFVLRGVVASGADGAATGSSATGAPFGTMTGTSPSTPPA